MPKLGDPNLMVGGYPEDELYLWAFAHVSSPTHDTNNKGCPFCAPITLPPSSEATSRLSALSIAASVFSQIDYTSTSEDGEETVHESRTVEDFRLSVDAVFKAAGLGEVDWGLSPQKEGLKAALEKSDKVKLGSSHV